MPVAQLKIVFTCPSCGKDDLVVTRSDVCTVQYNCSNCGAGVRPLPQDDCVFCSYGEIIVDATVCAQETCSTARCLPERSKRAHVALGISPFNSYYSEGRLASLFRWGESRFDRVDVFVPDVPTTWTLEAGGYSPHEASRKTKGQLRYLNNKIERAAADAQTSGKPIAALPWSAMSNMDDYQELHERCEIAFKADSGFRKACLETTDEVLENRRRDGYVPDDADRMKAVNYLMAELPLILFGSILMKVRTSTFVYHRPPVLFERLFSGEFTISPATGQHFVIATEP